MFAQFRIENKIIRYFIIILFLFIVIPLLGILIDVIRIYGVMIGSKARYVLTTNTF